MVQRTAAFLVLLTTLGSAQEEETVAGWNTSAGLRYLSRYTNYGLDLGGDSPAIGYDLNLTHEGGVSLEGRALQPLEDAGGFQEWSLALGYEFQAGESLILSGEFTHFEYRSDSVNVLAGLSNSLSVGLELSFEFVDVSFSYDRYFGSSSATYFSFDVSSYHALGDLSIVPLAQAVFMSQEVESRFLSQKKGRPTASQGQTVVTTVSGMSNLGVHLIFIYPVVERLTAAFHPSFQLNPQADVSSRKSQFVWSMGLRYSIDL